MRVITWDCGWRDRGRGWMGWQICVATLGFASAALNAKDVTGPGLGAKPALRVLRDECLGCHKPGKAKGGLLLTSREKTLRGGDSGPALIEGKASESLLFQLVCKEGDPHMPPKKQLSDIEIAMLKSWIDSGAAWDAAVFDELPRVKPVTLAPLPGGYQPVLALALSPDEKFLAVARGAEIFLHDLTKPERPPAGRLTGHVEAVSSLVWRPDGKSIISGGFRQIRIWDVGRQEPTGEVSGKLVGPITALAAATPTALFAADGETGGAGFIHRIDIATGQITATWKAHDDNVYALQLSADGSKLVSASADKLARIWNAADGKLISTFEGHTNHVLAAAFNQDGTQLATAGADRELKVWDVVGGEQIVSLGDKKSAFTALDWTPDGKFLVALTDKGGGSIFSELKKHTGGERSDTGKAVKLNAIQRMVYALAVTADGKTLFAGTDDGRVQIWDSNGKGIGALEPSDPVTTP